GSRECSVDDARRPSIDGQVVAPCRDRSSVRGPRAPRNRFRGKTCRRMSAATLQVSAPRQAPTRRPDPYSLAKARALVRCAEVELEFLRQCQADLYTAGRVNSLLVKLHLRRAALARLE